MATQNLRKREHGYELTGSEKYHIFEKEDQGYVRLKGGKKNVFFLDPSPFEDAIKNEIYVCVKPPYPPKDRLVEVTVRETEDVFDIVGGYPVKTVLKYVYGWNLIDPNTVIANQLLRSDEFTTLLTDPIKKCYFKEDLGYCMGLSLVSSPPLTDFDRGGINTVVLSNRVREARGAFSRISGIIPSSFRKPSAKYYYRVDTKPELNNYLVNDYLIRSKEFSSSYINISSVPVHIPVPLNVDFRTYNAQIEHFKYATPIARAYMLDALLFQPDIPETYRRIFEDLMYEILQETRDVCKSYYTQDYGDLLSKLAMSFARLKFHKGVEKNDIKDGLEAWLNMATNVTKSERVRKTHGNVHATTVLEFEILSVLNEMKDTGIEMTIDNLRSRVKCDDYDFEDSFNRLKNRGFIYVPRYGMVGLVEVRE